MTGRWRSRGVVCLNLLAQYPGEPVSLQKPTRRLFAARSGGEDSRMSVSIVFRVAAGCLRVFRFAAAMFLELLDVSQYVKNYHENLK